MLKFFHSKYELVPMTQIGATPAGGARKGALLKVQWPNGNTGYADLFPWPEFGDQPIDEQLTALAQGKLSILAEQAIWLAKKDAILRKEKKSAFAGAAKIKNHFLVPDFTRFTDSTMKELRTSGFTCLKVKVGKDVEEEAKFVSRIIKQNPVTVRLDFNAKASFEKYEKFVAYLGSAERPKIEFVEDPMPWDPLAWETAAKFGIPLAIDQELEKLSWDKMKTPLPFKVVVIKPARIDVEKMVKIIDKFALKMIVTSSLDHPVGVAHASAVASDLKKFYPNTLLDCGCLTMRAYRPNDYSSRIQVQGPYLTNIPGTGIGFDDLFDKAVWTPVGK